MTNSLAWLDEALADLERRALRRTLTTRQSPQRSDRIEIDGRSLVNFGSNDYLGLAAHPAIVQAVQAAAGEHGFGAGASPLVTGRSALHARLELELADFEGTEAALLFPSGYAANVGAITSLVGKEDAVFSDELNHASIIDGCRLSGAVVHIYKHADLEHLAAQLRSGSFRRRLIVTDSMFSMTGDWAPLAGLAELADRSRAMLMADEAHATGVFGRLGRGLCEQLHVEAGVQVRVGTLSKALGSVGGFVAGSRRLIDWLANRARPYGFSTALPAAAAAAALVALDLVRANPPWRTELMAKAERLRERLRSAGFEPGNSQSQIVPIVLRDPGLTVAAGMELRDQGLFVPAIRPPSVPPDHALLRISLTRLHTDEHLDRLIAALGSLQGRALALQRAVAEDD